MTNWVQNELFFSSSFLRNNNGVKNVIILFHNAAETCQQIQCSFIIVHLFIFKNITSFTISLERDSCIQIIILRAIHELLSCSIIVIIRFELLGTSRDHFRHTWPTDITVIHITFVSCSRYYITNESNVSDAI